jgi:hypothetical protein
MYGVKRLELDTQFWVVNTVYKAGVRIIAPFNNYYYLCILGHTSNALDEPGVGVNWATYWTLQTLAQAHSRGVMEEISEESITGFQVQRTLTPTATGVSSKLNHPFIP